MSNEYVIPIDSRLRRRVEKFARANKTSEADVIRAAIEAYCAAREGESCYERAERAGLIGCVADAPADLSTNPAHLEGFGRG